MRTTLRLITPLLGVLFAAPSFAQGLSSGGITSGAPSAPKSTYKPAEPPPPAVPGARARPDSVAPANPGAVDMPPTEALFDAINRGDIVSARDAISRGADLDGTNLLGLTPLELSVDLGRNDISFLLLSMRGSGGSSAEARNQGATAATQPPSPADRKRAEAEARAESRAQARQAKLAAAPGPAQSSRQGPALFAGNGGSAVPSAGFLGFDPHQ